MRCRNNPPVDELVALAADAATIQVYDAYIRSLGAFLCEQERAEKTRS